MKYYPIRMLKSLIMFFGMVMIFFSIGYYLGGVDKSQLSFWEFAQMSNLKHLTIFLIVFSFVYPLVAFISKKVYTNGPLTSDNKQTIVDIMTNANYILAKDENNVLTFRHKTAYVRFMRLLFEDAIYVNYSDNPLVVEGLRRDAYRLSRVIEQRFRKEATGE